VAKSVDINLQDALNLEPVANKYQAQLNAAGIKVEFMVQLRTEIETLQAKDVRQKEAVAGKETATRAQNEKMRLCRACQKKVINIAKNAYVDNRERLKEFHVGNAYIQGVAQMLTELAYLKSAVTTHQDELASWGADAALITEIEVCIADLTAADNTQENAKNLQNVATVERDRASKILKNSKNRIRRAAQIVFADNPDVRKEFESTVE